MMIIYLMIYIYSSSNNILESTAQRRSHSKPQYRARLLTEPLQQKEQWISGHIFPACITAVTSAAGSKYYKIFKQINKKILPFSHLSSDVLARSGAVRTCIQWL